MNKVKRSIKRIICLILLIVFSPVILLYLLISSIVKYARKKQWKKNGLTGMNLALMTDIDFIDKMQDFEAYDFFKYLFFFDGFNVKYLKTRKSYPQFYITKNTEEYLVMYNVQSSSSIKNDLTKLEEYKTNNDIKRAIYVTNKSIKADKKQEYLLKSIKIIDRNELIEYISKVQNKLKESTPTAININKSINEQIDEMYPNRI